MHSITHITLREQIKAIAQGYLFEPVSLDTSLEVQRRIGNLFINHGIGTHVTYVTFIHNDAMQVDVFWKGSNASDDINVYHEGTIVGSREYNPAIGDSCVQIVRHHFDFHGPA